MEEPQLETDLPQEFQERIEEYFAGNLSEEQVDTLWVECIADGKKMDYMSMYANLKMLKRSGKL